uniref:Uncharacterized protein n=1 Tax=Echeneis naucrates TaxID=173247 RepID=A0A665UK03_ECHNA
MWEFGVGRWFELVIFLSLEIAFAYHVFITFFFAVIPHCQCVKLYKSVKNPSNISRVLVIKPLEAVDLKKIDLLCLDPKEKFTQLFRREMGDIKSSIM